MRLHCGKIVIIVQWQMPTLCIYVATIANKWHLPTLPHLNIFGCGPGMWNNLHFVITLVITFLKFILLQFHYVFKWLRNSSQWLWNGFLISLHFFLLRLFQKRNRLFQKRNRYFCYNVIVSLRFTSLIVCLPCRAKLRLAKSWKVVWLKSTDCCSFLINF